MVRFNNIGVIFIETITSLLFVYFMFDILFHQTLQLIDVSVVQAFYVFAIVGILLKLLFNWFYKDENEIDLRKSYGLGAIGFFVLHLMLYFILKPFLSIKIIILIMVVDLVVICAVIGTILYFLIRAAKSTMQIPSVYQEHEIFEALQVSEQNIPKYHVKKILEHDRFAVFEIDLPPSSTLEQTKQVVADCIMKFHRLKDNLILIAKNQNGSKYMGGYLQSKQDYESVKHFGVHIDAETDEYPVLFFEDESALYFNRNVRC